MSGGDGGDADAGGGARRRRRRGSRVEKDTPPRELRRVLRNRELARVSNEKRRVRLACMQDEMEALRAEAAAAVAERDAALARVADLEAILARRGAGGAPTLAPTPAVSGAGAPGGMATLPLRTQPLTMPQAPPVHLPDATAVVGNGYVYAPPHQVSPWAPGALSSVPVRTGAHMLLQAAAVGMT